MLRHTTILFALGAATLLGCHSNSTTPPNPAFQADPPSVYVAKVKNILLGEAPTDAEVAAVVADPTALSGLVSGWMTSPATAALYQQKMQVFFELAFQQTQITGTDLANQIPPNGLTVGLGVTPLVQNMSESVARTAISTANAGQPITNLFTTKQLMMTPALKQLYAFLDEYQVDDNSTPTDAFALENKKLGGVVLEESAGPIALADTLNPSSQNYMHWYVPGLASEHYPSTVCTGMDPIKFAATGLQLEQMLFGEIPTHLGTDGVTKCITRPAAIGLGQFAASDFDTWSLVTIRPPNAGEQTTQFDDLATLRTTGELVLKTPHPGFFSTPAFFANWPTNSSNEMRVILNQALIVATGAAIDGTDTTVPPSTPGLDAAHANSPACLGCHQLLDPSRSILAATYSWFGEIQTDPTWTSQPGLFAFQGVISDVKTIDDFANVLATHPLVATAWAQKLCYYANSAACDPTDPAFTKIVADFKSASFSWSTLVSELMTSPIVTNATETKTWDTNGEVVAVARRDHLCASLNNRLGFVDICGLDATVSNPAKPSTIAQIVQGLPSDGYGRGAPIPVLPLSPTLFYRAGLENICTAVGTLIIDAAAPGAGQKNWSSTQPDAAIADFVSIVMALPTSDARSAGAVSALAAHYASAMTNGAPPTDALRSTFVVACLSPSFLGIGM